MSVLIKGMEMPKNCVDCPFSDHEAWCLIPGKWQERYYCPKDEISEHCPLIEVPEPHGELIDRHEAYLRFGKLAETLEEKNGYEAGAPYAMAALFLNNVEEFPTIIPASEEG